MGNITVVGLGPGSWWHLTLEGVETLEKAQRIFLRTEKHPVVEHLKDRGIKYSSFDSFYNEEATFEGVYSRIAKVLIEETKNGDLVYAVPGNPAVAETSYYLLLGLAKERGIEVLTVPGMSFLEIVYQRLGIDPVKGLQVLDGLGLKAWRIDTGKDLIITQVYDRLTASEVKLALLERYGVEHPIWVIRAAGVKGREIVQQISLYRLDRLSYIDYLTSVYVPASKEKVYNIEDLIEIMRTLRGEEGCPWDREQDRQSLKPYLLEEAYEVLDAIEKEDLCLLSEELGDLLLQVVFHAQIADEEGEFDFDAVVGGICEKLIRRHPHVFGGKKARDSDGALDKWEASKRKEKGVKGYTGALRDIPQTLPSLMRSYKVQQKAALAGFDWEEIEDVMDKVREELTELEEVYKTGEMSKIKEELGDLLFAVVNLARFEGVRPELALRETIEKFIQRFDFVEDGARKLGKTLDKMTLDQMEDLWQRAKVHKFNKNDKK
ncbi:MAG: nucleoside triphosphate pyrophosphohydrolase [Bacillota bacterium]|nr:nucleoside triphosphate pyrophosphohydrolase [Bacillota bacterium]MDD3298726.1 nucleoside triphosphate pyrophosphohydrolase [Bacillota bacterium]MDD3850293.1 nucleoside triphosphate pyrophosphohydrolase [Bacillota bacterium]MDD4707614.1 nucleoside triphosphate pyrophosphohydrolase [Bacillota bacterium]